MCLHRGGLGAIQALARAQMYLALRTCRGVSAAASSLDSQRRLHAHASALNPSLDRLGTASMYATAVSNNCPWMAQVTLHAQVDVTWVDRNVGDPLDVIQEPRTPGYPPAPPFSPPRPFSSFFRFTLH
jgi:hypothetical protein